MGRQEAENGPAHYEMEEDSTDTEDADTTPTKLIFGVKDTPPIQIIIFYSIQVSLNIISGPMTISYLVYNSVCAEGNEWLFAKLISTSLVAVGVCTCLQVTLGVRLPILQGSSQLYFYTVGAILHMDQWKCPGKSDMSNNSMSDGSNGTMATPADLEPWNVRIAEISGDLAMASVLHVLIGATGLVGFLMRFVGPLTLTPVIALIGLSLYDAINLGARHQWGVTLFVVVMSMIFAIVMEKKMVPIPGYARNTGCTCTRFPVFKIFASTLALILGCLLCYILTVTNALPSDPSQIGYYARTDAKIDAIYRAPWVFFPYPGQFGPLTFQWVATVGFIPVILGSIMESVGDYTATARACEIPLPPNHAVNRGIAIEGLGSILTALVGACHATTSYSNMVGLIAYSGVGARVVWLASGILCIALGVFGKFGALLAMVPDPIISALLVLSLAMVFSVSIQNLAAVDISHPRNQMILGLSLVLGIAMPIGIKMHPENFQTESDLANQILVTLLSNGPLIGGLVGFILDNSLPGSKKLRGIVKEATTAKDSTITADIYSFPFPKSWNSVKLFRYIPFLPCFTGASCGDGCCRTKRKPEAVNMESKIVMTGNHTDLDDEHYAQHHPLKMSDL